MEKIVRGAGYGSVAGFMKAYKKAEKVVEDYLKVNGAESHEPGKKSVLAELERIKHSSNYLRPDPFCREHEAEKQSYVI